MSVEKYFPYYEASPFFICQADQRFSYCLYVPASYYVEKAGEVPLVVAVHGSRRTAEGYRNAFAEFAEANGCVVLAPLFPIGARDAYVEAPQESHNYKYLEFSGIRFDLILLEMIAELRTALPRVRDTFALFGFSGGGQFVHRFYYLHPERLDALSVGAPGTVTRLLPDVDWWPGTRGVSELFGREIDLNALRQVPVQLVVGADDIQTWNVRVKPDSWTWREGANDAGENRVQRLTALTQNLCDNGIDATLEVVKGVGHSGLDVLEPVCAFFAKCLDRKMRS